MTRTRVLSVAAAAIATAAGAVVIHAYRAPRPSPVLVHQTITRGDIIETVVAIGTVQATRTVEIGAQVSGLVSTLHADFNSLVRRGDILAEIDPALARDALASAQSGRDVATIALDAGRNTLQTDRAELARQLALFSDGLGTELERDAARVVVDEDELTVAQAEASVSAAEATVNTARLDLEHCTIRSPVDGVVISRNVDVGQTLESRATPPTLFVVATNLDHVDVMGNVDESDVARIRPGQDVRFTVEAHPEPFQGRVSEVRLNATNVNNVVTYQTVITAVNPQLHLLPGMTATFSIETRRVTNVVRVPNAALRFRPPATLMRAAPAKTAPSDVVMPTGSDRTAVPAVKLSSASSIDAVLGAQPARDIAGTVWVTDAHGLSPVTLRLGATDGTWTEVRLGPLHEDDAVVTGIRAASSTNQDRR